MLGALTPADRKLLLGAAVFVVLLVAGTVLIGPPNRGPESSVPSTYSSASAGARAAYLLLRDLRYPVRRWEEPPDHLADAGHSSVLILAEPTDKPSKHEKQALLRFVQSGGRILFCGDAIQSFFSSAMISESVRGADWEKFSAGLPSYFSQGAENIIMQPKAFWKRPAVTQLPLYGNPDAAAIITWRMGAGELVWWAGATPLTNAGIRQADNLRLFLNAVSPRSPNQPANIYWDEYFHGQRGSLWSYVAGTPVAWGLLQLGFILAAVLFTFSRRWGPIAAPTARSRLSPLEFVDTLGGLYERAGATSVAVDVAYRHLRLKLTQKLALPAAITNPNLAAAAHARLGWNSDELQTTLERAGAAAATRKLSAAAGLELIQNLEAYTHRLGVPKISVPESH